MEREEASRAIDAAVGSRAAKDKSASQPGVFDRIVQIASTSELDMVANRAQRRAAAKAESTVSFHGAVDRFGSGGKSEISSRD